MNNNYNFQKVEKLIVKEKTKFHQIYINEIINIYSEAGISSINKINNDKITCAKNLSYFEVKLKKMNFVKANRNEYINFAFIVDFNVKKRQIRLTNNHLIDVSCRNLKLFIRKFKNIETLETNI